ncbi:MAG: transposase [Deltaproteobacteria bacterium]|nr:transposase [Deltaproteobacteria bacterium]
MPNYRRANTAGATYFFTVVTYGRQRWLCEKEARDALRGAIREVRATRPFQIRAFVLLPDHLHCLWTLPEGDADLSTRWRLVKSGTTRRLTEGGLAAALELHPASASRKRSGECTLWQRRFWEHQIRDERDYSSHCDYVHYNPVRHGLVRAPQDWPNSTFHRYVEQGIYSGDWGAEPMSFADMVGRE